MVRIFIAFRLKAGWKLKMPAPTNCEYQVTLPTNEKFD